MTAAPAPERRPRTGPAPAPARPAPVRAAGADRWSGGPLRPVGSDGAHRPAPRRDRRRALVALAGAAIALGLFSHVGITALSARSQFRLEQLKAEAAEKEARYQRLRLEVATLEAPERVVERARRLGMVEPDKVTYLTPTGDTVATGADSGRPHRAEPAGGEPSWASVKPYLDGLG